MLDFLGLEELSCQNPTRGSSSCGGGESLPSLHPKIPDNMSVKPSFHIVLSIIAISANYLLHRIYKRPL